MAWHYDIWGLAHCIIITVVYEGAIGKAYKKLKGIEGSFYNERFKG